MFSNALPTRHRQQDMDNKDMGNKGMDNKDMDKVARFPLNMAGLARTSSAGV